MTVTIGSMDNVPAPGDPIRSPWAQEVAGLARSVFASKAALDAATGAWSGLAAGAHAYTVAEAAEWVRIGSAWVGWSGGVPWIAPALTSPWVNAAGHTPTGYRRLGDRIELRGGLSCGAAGSGVMFTLPAGYRPPYITRLAAITEQLTVSYPAMLLEISVGGEVTGALANNGVSSITGLSFSLTA